MRKSQSIAVICGVLAAVIVLGAGAWFFGPLLLHNITTDSWRDLAETDAEYVMTSANWMVDLPDTMDLTEINMPGANHAAAKNISSGLLQKCQDSSIRELLHDGYRYLDLDFAEIDGQTAAVYGGRVCRTGSMPWADVLTLESILMDCRWFLEDHPTETIVLALPEGRELPDALVASVGEECFLQAETLPKLGEARGRMVVISGREGCGANLTDLSEGNKASHWLAALKNRAFIRELEETPDEEKTKLGWIVADFGSEELAWQVYMANYVE